MLAAPSSPYLPCAAISALAATLLSLGGCAESEVDCHVVTTFDDVAAFGRSCNTCHAATLEIDERSGAPPGIDFDNYDDAVESADRALLQLELGAMPPEGGPALSAADRADLLNWLQCGRRR